MLILPLHHVPLLPLIVSTRCISYGRRTSRDRIAPCRTPSRQPQNSWWTAPRQTSRSSSARSCRHRTPKIISSGRRTLSSPAQQRMAYPRHRSRCFCQHRGPGLLRGVQVPLMSRWLQPRAAARSRPRHQRGTALAVPQPCRRGDSSIRRQRRPSASSSAAPGRCRWRSTSSSAVPRSTRRTASAYSARCVMVCVLRRMQAVHFACREACNRSQMATSVASTLLQRLARLEHLMYGA